MSEKNSCHKELLVDSLATLRRVAGFLDESFGPQVSEPKETGPTNLGFPIFAGSRDMAEFVRDTHREVQELQEDIGAVNTLPCFHRQTSPPPGIRP